MDDTSLELTYAVVEFLEASRQWGIGMSLSDNDICGKALERSNAAELKIGDLTGSVDALLPLLDHENPAVLYNAAIPLLSDHRERAIVALKHVDMIATLDIAFFAGLALNLMGEPSLGTSFEKPDLPLEKVPTWEERRAILLERKRKAATKKKRR